MSKVTAVLVGIVWMVCAFVVGYELGRRDMVDDIIGKGVRYEITIPNGTYSGSVGDDGGGVRWDVSSAERERERLADDCVEPSPTTYPTHRIHTTR